jgi:hypothetical protein
MYCVGDRPNIYDLQSERAQPISIFIDLPNYISRYTHICPVRLANKSW